MFDYRTRNIVIDIDAVKSENKTDRVSLERSEDQTERSINDPP